jgi:uncharacterized coiled-coil DUF342 family protein
MTYEPVRPELSGNVFIKRIKELKAKKATAKANVKGEKAACKEAAADAFHQARVASAEATKEAAAQKEAATAECDKKPPKEKPACKKAATEAYKAATQKAAEEIKEARSARDAAIDKCKEIDANVAEIEKELEALTAEYTKLRDSRKAYVREALGHKTTAAGLRQSINTYRKEINEEHARIKAIPDPVVRKARRQALKANYAKIRDLQREVSRLRSKMVKLNILKETIVEKMGLKHPPVMGQHEHLMKKCLGEEPEAKPQEQAKAKPHPQPQPRPQPRPQPQPQPKRASEEAREAEAARLAALKPTVAEFSKMLTAAYQADPASIKKAYRRLTLEYHPDKHPEATRDYEHRFKNLQQAWTAIKARYGIQGGRRQKYVTKQ